MTAVAEKPKAQAAKAPLPNTETFATEAWNLVCEVEAVLRALLAGRPDKTFMTNGLWGVMSIIGTAANELDRFRAQPSHDECWHTLQSLQQASGLIYVIGCYEEDLIWDACLRLLSIAEDTLKTGMQELRHE